MANSKTASVGTVIDVSEVQVAPRGRKATLDTDLVAAFKSLPAGKAIALDGKFGSVAQGAERQKVSATIRKNWKAARPTDECRINFGTTGIPQVSAKVPAEAAE